MTVSVVESWNKIQKQQKNTLLKDLSPNIIKTVLKLIYSYLIIHIYTSIYSQL